MEMEEFIRNKGYNIPASPLITTATGSLSTAPILSPLNISSIPNPPPLPASLMSIPMTDNFPIFSMAQRRPHSKGSTGSFNEELFKYVEDFTARHQGSYGGSMTPNANAVIASHKSDTSSTESLDHRSSSPRMSYTIVESGQKAGNEKLQTDAQHTNKPTSSLIQENVIPNAQFSIIPNQVYNLHYPGSNISPFVSMSSPYGGAPFVEAGLLPVTNSYTPVVPVTTIAQNGTTVDCVSSTPTKSQS